MKTDYPDHFDEPEDVPSLPAGEMPDMDELPPEEPAGPPAATNDPFGASLINGSAVAPRIVVPPANPPRL